MQIDVPEFNKSLQPTNNYRLTGVEPMPKTTHTRSTINNTHQPHQIAASLTTLLLVYNSTPTRLIGFNGKASRWCGFDDGDLTKQLESVGMRFWTHRRWLRTKRKYLGQAISPLNHTERSSAKILAQHLVSRSRLIELLADVWSK